MNSNRSSTPSNTTIVHPPEPHRALTDGALAETHRDKSQRYISELQQFLNQHSKLLISLAVAQTYAPGIMNGIDEMDSLNTYFETRSSNDGRPDGGNTKSHRRAALCS